MICNSCRKTCAKSHHRVVCHDESVVTICRPCFDAWQAVEAMMNERSGQKFIMPPDGLAVLSEIAAHGGLKFSVQRNYGLSS